LEYKIRGLIFSCRWTNCIKGFKMPVRIFSGGKERWINPQEKWQTQKMATGFNEKTFSVDNNFYITLKKVNF
jgi:hypothetical protein